MKKNIVKTMLKAAATTAMVAAMFVGGNTLEAKASCTCAVDPLGCTEHSATLHQVLAEKGLSLDEYCNLTDFDLLTEIDDEVVMRETGCTMQDILDWEADFANRFYGEGSGETAYYETLSTVTTSHSEMLNLVNKDRKANGAGDLTWNADLEVIARERAMEAMSNAQTEEFLKASNEGNYEEYCRIIHQGVREGTKENAIVSFYSGVKAKTANQNWINSTGHHAQRIKAEWTQYACASYTDPVTGMETWMEIFQ